jgi:hypothetical protein
MAQPRLHGSMMAKLWMKKMSHSHSMEHYSAIKKNEIMPLAGKWMELEVIMLNDISQTHKDKDHVFSRICDLDFKKRHESRRGAI